MIDLYMWDKLKNENLNLHIERGVLRGRLTELTNQLACKIVERRSADDEMIAHLESELQRIKSIFPKEVEVIKEVIKIEKVPVEVIKEVVKIRNVSFKDPTEVEELAALTRKHKALKSRFDEIAIRVSDVNNK